MGHAEPRPWTLDEFLDWERAQAERYEYVGGVIRMMTGGSNDHRRILGNAYRALANRLVGGGCEAFVEGPKILVHDQSLYPDVAVICGEVLPKADYAVDAVVIVEVLSPSTDAYDRGAKWQAYQALPSLRHYLLVSQDACVVDLYTREGDGWRPMRFKGQESTVPLTALEFDLPIAELYRNSPAAYPTTIEL